MIRLAAVAALAATLLGPRLAASQEVPLTLEGALARAREHSPAALAARTRVDEARGARADARVLVQDNPALEGAAGPRWSAGDRSTDWEIGIAQPLGPPGSGTARLASATAGVDRASATAEDATRQALGEVARSFLSALAAQERVGVATAGEDAAAAVLVAVERRDAAGDATALSVRLARIEAVRARADRRAAEARLATMRADLLALLALDPGADLRLQGPLAVPGDFELATLLARAGERPDLLALEAERRAAQADLRLGRSMALPSLGLRAAYAREGEERVVTGGLSVTLPVFQRGQGLRIAARARAERARIEAEAARRAAESDVRGAHEAWRQLSLAAREVEDEALPALAEVEALALASYEAGEIDLESLLLARRQAAETRLALVDRRLDAALAAVEVQLRAGVIR